MNKEKGYIRIGLFENFEGEDTILITADINGLLELKEIFLKLTNEQNKINFSSIKFLDKKYNINLIAFKDTANIGIINKDGILEWRVKPEKWKEFSDKLIEMYRNGKSGHHYLDSDSIDNKDYQVKFSWNESLYDIEFWKEHQQ